MNVLATDLAAQSLRTPARNELIRTGLLNAQHWLEHGCDLLGQGLLGDWQTVAIMVERHLLETVAALRESSSRPAAIAAQLDATTRATNDYWYGVLAYCSRRKLRVDRSFERAMDRIFEKIDQARELLQLTHELSEVHARAGHTDDHTDDHYEAMAILPVLELIRLEAIRALLQLGGKDAPARDLVEEARVVLERHVAHAEFLISEHDGNDAQFAAPILAASDAVLALARAARERVGIDLDRVLDGLAVLRSAVQAAAA
jgi:hypothetical protein